MRQDRAYGEDFHHEHTLLLIQVIAAHFGEELDFEGLHLRAEGLVSSSGFATDLVGVTDTEYTNEKNREIQTQR